MESFDALIAREDVPVIEADDSGVIVKINAAFEALYGWSQADLEGRLLSTIIPVPLRDAHHLGLSRFLNTEKSVVVGHPVDLEVMTKGGDGIKSQHLIHASKQDGRWRFAAALTPTPSDA